jgi:hypothetical protein
MGNPEGSMILPPKQRGDIEEGSAGIYQRKERTDVRAHDDHGTKDGPHELLPTMPLPCKKPHQEPDVKEQHPTLTLPHNRIRTAKLMYMTHVGFRHISQTPPPNTKAA